LIGFRDPDVITIEDYKNAFVALFLGLGISTMHSRFYAGKDKSSFYNKRLNIYVKSPVSGFRLITLRSEVRSHFPLTI
jgi:hypothetical protein